GRHDGALSVRPRRRGAARARRRASSSARAQSVHTRVRRGARPAVRGDSGRSGNGVARIHGAAALTDRNRLRSALPAAAVLAATLLGAPAATAQPFGPPPPPPGPPRESAPIDLTGQWVAVVNEDWRWRMVTPPKGDYASVPLNAEGRRVAEQWEPSRDGACEAYGAAGLLRM